MNSYAKHEELTVLKDGRLILFDPKRLLSLLNLYVRMNENFPASSLSLNVANNILRVLVNMDTLMEKDMNVILRDETFLNFKKCGSGLYYYDMASNDVQDIDKTNTIIIP